MGWTPSLLTLRLVSHAASLTSRCCTRAAWCLSTSCKLTGFGTSLFTGASFAKVVAERESHHTSDENSH